MIDILGNPLAVGDVVAYPAGNGSRGSLMVGSIIRVGEKMVILGPALHPRSSRREGIKRYPQDVLRIS